MRVLSMTTTDDDAIRAMHLGRSILLAVSNSKRRPRTYCKECVYTNLYVLESLIEGVKVPRL